MLGDFFGVGVLQYLLTGISTDLDLEENSEQTEIVAEHIQYLFISSGPSDEVRSWSMNIVSFVESVYRNWESLPRLLLKLIYMLFQRKHPNH